MFRAFRWSLHPGGRNGDVSNSAYLLKQASGAYEAQDARALALFDALAAADQDGLLAGIRSAAAGTA